MNAEKSEDKNNLKTIVNDNEEENVAKILEGLTIEQVLGKPIWSKALQEVTFTSLADFEDALAKWKEVLQQHMVEYNFNTFVSYNQFYQNFQMSNKKPLEFYLNHEQPVFDPEYLSCATLSVHLLKSLQEKDQQNGPYFALICSEEFIPEKANSKIKYDIESQDVLKRHVLIGLKFVLCGRIGYVLLDSGYSIPHPIVVMQDGAYPHTGRYTSSSLLTGKIEERHYKLVNDQFIQWQANNIDQATGELRKATKTNLIYVGKEFQSHKSFIRKRGLTVNFKACVVRNSNGLVAMFYSFIEKKSLIILYRQNATAVRHQFSIDDLDKEEVKEALRMVAQCCSDDESSCVDEKVGKYLQTLQNYRKALLDENFTSDMFQLGKWIDGRQQQIDFLC